MDSAPRDTRPSAKGRARSREIVAQHMGERLAIHPAPPTKPHRPTLRMRSPPHVRGEDEPRRPAGAARNVATVARKRDAWRTIPIAAGVRCDPEPGRIAPPLRMRTGRTATAAGTSNPAGESPAQSPRGSNAGLDGDTPFASSPAAARRRKPGATVQRMPSSARTETDLRL